LKLFAGGVSALRLTFLPELRRCGLELLGRQTRSPGSAGSVAVAAPAGRRLGSSS